MARFPPYVLVQALEACCAYWESYRTKPLTEDVACAIVDHVRAFEDPVLNHLIGLEDGLFQFGHYMHRTQIESQGQAYWLPVGRAVRVCGDPSLRAIASAFQNRYGLSVREWLKLAFQFHAIAIKPPFGLSYRALPELEKLGHREQAIKRFLEILACSPAEIGSHYRAIRGESESNARSPCTWAQSKPLLAKCPFVKLGAGIMAPFPAFVSGLFQERLFSLIGRLRSSDCSQEFGESYERYVGEVIREVAHRQTVWDESVLRRTQQSSTCDYVVDADDCLLCIECKASVLDPEFTTKNAVLRSTAGTHIADGEAQILTTAATIRSGGYESIGISRDKPLLGMVALMGEFPLSNHPAVREASAEKLQKRGILKHRELLAEHVAILDGLSIEKFALFWRTNANAVKECFAQRRCGAPFSLGSWGVEITHKLGRVSEADIAFWRLSGQALVSEVTGGVKMSAKSR